MQYKYQAQDTEGKWHDITAMQYAALRCEGVPVRRVSA